MKYKGYSAKIEYDSDAKIFHGEVIGIKDVITFQGSSINELEEAFHESLNDYLAFCKERNEKPEKPCSGRFNLRITPELHAALWIAAQEKGTSLNNYIAQTLQTHIS